LLALGDLPGGGHHLNLILAGALGVPVTEAEELKRLDNAGVHTATLKPGIERIAANIGRLLDPRPAGPVHLVGGALMTPGAGQIVSRYIEHPVVEHDHALLMTPFGIALS
jgi:ethanolamine utilization protein EutJ